MNDIILCFLFSLHLLKAEGVLEQLKGKEGAWRVVEVADFPPITVQTLGMKIVLDRGQSLFTNKSLEEKSALNTSGGFKFELSRRLSRQNGR